MRIKEIILDKFNNIKDEQVEYLISLVEKYSVELPVWGIRDYVEHMKGFIDNKYSDERGNILENFFMHGKLLFIEL